MYLSAWLRETLILTVAWIGSLQSSLKFVRADYPSEVELSTIDSAQSPFTSLPLIMSTYGVMMEVMGSSRLVDALNFRCKGM